MISINSTGYKHRQLARIVIEAETPLAIGTGSKSIISDSLVATDMNGMPYIPGTTIAGVVRSMLEGTDEWFGYQDYLKDNGHGSEIIFTEGKIIDLEGNVLDGIVEPNDSDFYELYSELPIRQHVRIGGNGCADNSGKFDEQIVFAGTRFCFEFEIFTKDGTEDKSTEILSTICDKSFRLGSGSRSGFGKVKIISVQTKSLDLTKEKDMSLYLAKSSNLQEDRDWEGWNDCIDLPREERSRWDEYKLILHPDNFFLFGSGFGDENGDANMTGVRATKIIWSDYEPYVGKIEKECILIPAASIKGAIRHRVAFNYNKRTKQFVGMGQPADMNEGVKNLFGSAIEKDNFSRGNVIFSDIIKVLDKDKVKSKFINHVSIDRFTGGAIEGALFTEKADYSHDDEYVTTILVKHDALEDDDVKYAFNNTLKEIASGMLPLGGGVNRGNGIFTGSITINGELWYEMQQDR